MLPSTTGMRYRSKSLAKTVNTEWWQNEFYRDHGSPQISKGDGKLVVTGASDDELWDVSIPQFYRRQANGEIFNNPMIKHRLKYSNPVTPRYVRISETANPRNYDVYSGTTFHEMPASRLTFPEQRMIDNAVTQAYSNVSANHGNTVLWIGEMKETVKMLFDIGTLIKALHLKTKAQRLLWAKGKLSVKEAQQLTLAILYGILPLEQQITDFMDGLFSTKETGTRATARGFRLDTKSGSYQDVISDGDFTEYTRYWNESLEIQVRAGVLYDIDLTNVPWLSVILEPKAVISTAYALARLSFVLDWFVNVGGALAAWSPSMGVKELSAWVTVETTRTIAGNVNYVLHGEGKTLSHHASSPKGTSSFHSQETIKYRVPVSREDLAIIPRLDVNLDLSKIASLVLLFVKIK